MVIEKLEIEENTNECKNCITHTLILPLLYELAQQTWIQAIIYFILMLGLFIGIALIAEVFMCSIETITSAKRKVVKQSKCGTEKEIIETPIWNKTVANLSLMALGSAAPEFFLATIEVIGNGFEAGELGPGAIVGASAFNLFITIAICVVSIPQNQSKRIQTIKAFAVSSFFNVFAYIWLFLVLTVFTPDIINITEASLTLLFFPLLVLIGYAADRDFFMKDKWPKFDKNLFSNKSEKENDLKKFIREIRKFNPNLTAEECEQLATVHLFDQENHSAMFYRISARRRLSAATPIIPQLNEKLYNIYNTFNNKSEESVESSKTNNFLVNFGIKSNLEEKHENYDKAIVNFMSESTTVLENQPNIEIIIERSGKLDNSFFCEIETLDRTAIANCDYKPVKQVINFGPNETQKKVSIYIISNNVWSPDKIFLVKLSLVFDDKENKNNNVIKGDKSIMQITIIDDDEPGIIEFEQRMVVIADSENMVNIPLIRCQGSDGEVRVKWRTVDGNAKNGEEYYGGEGESVFRHGNIKEFIKIPIFNRSVHEKDEYFELVLIEATGGATIGRINRVMITITTDEDYDKTTARIMAKVNDYNESTFRLHREQWLEQINEAFSFGNSNSNGFKTISAMDYFLHFICFGWKVIFSLLPPTRIMGGWATFFSSLVVIGIMTALLGDLASTFGCTIGLRDYVTAITFVAIGTGLPDLFATRTAARRERHADNAIGNVTGSNAFNVFLGLGLPWISATIYHSYHGSTFHMSSENLGFSIVLYTILTIIALGILVARRNLAIFGRGELGGPHKYAIITSVSFVIIWVIYLTLSIWQVYTDKF